MDSSKDGMLFVIATDDEDDLNVAIASPGKRAGTCENQYDTEYFEFEI